MNALDEYEGLIWLGIASLFFGFVASGVIYAIQVRHRPQSIVSGYGLSALMFVLATIDGPFFFVPVCLSFLLDAEQRRQFSGFLVPCRRARREAERRCAEITAAKDGCEPTNVVQLPRKRDAA